MVTTNSARRSEPMGFWRGGNTDARTGDLRSHKWVVGVRGRPERGSGACKNAPTRPGCSMVREVRGGETRAPGHAASGGTDIDAGCPYVVTCHRRPSEAEGLYLALYWSRCRIVQTDLGEDLFHALGRTGTRRGVRHCDSAPPLAVIGLDASIGPEKTYRALLNRFISSWVSQCAQ